jgi:hypothetical protein
MRAITLFKGKAQKYPARRSAQPDKPKDGQPEKQIVSFPGRVAVFQCFQPQAGMPSDPN